MLLEVRHLMLVDAIVQAGSVTRAAGRLHLTQSALSHQLLDIEARLGTPLFTRLARRMVLTPAGDRVLASARRVLDDLHRAEDDLRAMAAGSAGVLRLCTECNTGYHWLPPILQSFQTRFPKVEVQIAIEATTRPLEALFDGEIDLAVMTSSVADSRVTATTIFEDELLAVVAPTHRLAGRPWIEPVEFAREHLMLHRIDRKTSYTLSRILGPDGVTPARLSEVPLTEAILELVKAGIGVGVLAGWAIGPALKQGTVAAIRIGRAGHRRTWKAVTLADRARAPWMHAFVTLLAERGPGAMPSVGLQRDDRVERRRPARGPRGRRHANQGEHAHRR